MTPLPWYQRDPDTIDLEDANSILSDPDSRAHFPNQFNALIQSIQSRVEQLKEQSRHDNPLAWFQPSYEQTLKLNCWFLGIDYIVDFDANRIGKTAGGVVNGLLWLLPNDPDWLMFRPYTDHRDRTFQTIPRPPINALKGIRNNLASRPDLPPGNPRLPYDHPENLECYKATILYLSQNPPKPNPPKRQVWIGGPDSKWIDENVAKEWQKWTPKAFILKPYNYKQEMVLAYDNPGNKVHPISSVEIYFKSYDSDDTKWSGGAVDGIMMSEGIPKTIFNEIKQRFKYPAFASWDYTPYEPRNTGGKSALAHKVFKGEEQLPLSPTIFSGFGIEDCPTYIMDEDKRRDLIRAWSGKAEGEARIKGIFYTSSPVVLKNYDPPFHCLPLTLDQLRKKWAPRPLILFRGLDPGWGHVTSCAWMALAPDNNKYIYRIYAQSMRSIEERCTDIIDLSGNKRVPHPKAKEHWQEQSTLVNRVRITFLDYHSFKTDENTKRPFALNYTKNGLVVRPSVTFGPKERAVMFNDMLLPQLHMQHPIKGTSPGCKVFFLVGEDNGVAVALAKMENIFWQTFEKGEKQGLTKDVVQDYDDDELDAVCYVTCPILNYSSFLSGEDTNRQEGKTRLSYAGVDLIK